ncbi:protein translocase subunit SecA [Acrasis kona]|uniref:Protein translocase subunit SecA n=1 Tax=Acrasis kona TaxID=1008807 RepID=A0AAW2ZII6_9EUKA
MDVVNESTFLATSPQKISISKHHELFSHYDALIKQMDKLRSEAFSRIHDRIKRTQYIAHISVEQLGNLESKIADIETKVADAKNQNIGDLLGYKDNSFSGINIDQLIDGVEDDDEQEEQEEKVLYDDN